MEKSNDEEGAAAAASSSNPSSSSEEPQAGNSTGGNDFQITLNDFLEFLKLSCHVNDMITKADSKSHIREPVPPAESAAGISSVKRNLKKDVFDFNSLVENPLVNQLLGLKISHHRSNSRENSSHSNVQLTDQKSFTHRSVPGLTKTTRGLHPKLNEQLDYVINEGVLDSVLSFICPPSLPSSLTTATTARSKAGPGKAQPKGNETTAPASAAAAIASPAASKSTAHSHSSPSVSPPRDNAEGSGMVRVKDSSGKSAPNTSRRKSILLAKDCKHARQEKKEWVLNELNYNFINLSLSLCRPEVVIHVCDEVKNTSRDFTCPQNLLISKMGYFADVTAGQRLEEMDISVHCDIQIFDWLMKWIKHSSQTQEVQVPGDRCTPAGPQLDGNNVVPILVSASFLQMEPLLLECLSFCHAHLSEVVRTSTNLSCLNDALVCRLAAMFTNLELEMVRDKKERVTPRLWTKLIQSLCEPDPEVLRGHFYSISGLFRCVRCCRCVTNTMKSYVNCIPSNIRLNRWGQLISNHVRDTNWDLNVYVMQLFKELKSWRKVYWKLWGHCHYLFCCSCEAHFPVYQMNWCRYHPEPPNFLGPEIEGRIAGPAGRYACCNQQAFRFETLPGPNVSGEGRV